MWIYLKHQQQVAAAVERAKQVTMTELNAIIGVRMWPWSCTSNDSVNNNNPVNRNLHLERYTIMLAKPLDWKIVWCCPSVAFQVNVAEVQSRPYTTVKWD